MSDPITIFSLDLGYLRSGYAIIRQPGDQVLKHGVVLAEPQKPKKVTEEHRVQRAQTAFDGLRLALFYADQDFGPLDALVYEEPQGGGAALRRGQRAKAAGLALGMALERMFLVLALVGWAKMDSKGGGFTMRPIHKLDPARWQPLFTGVRATQTQSGQMKRLVRRTLALRMAEDERFDIKRLGPDEVDAIAIGLVGSKLLQIEGRI